MNFLVIEVFKENPMLLVAVIVFLICVIIGFFGDRYLKNKNEISKILDDSNEEKQTQQVDNIKSNELVKKDVDLVLNESSNIVNINTLSDDIDNKMPVGTQITNQNGTSANNFNLENANNGMTNPLNDVNLINNPTPDLSKNINQEISEPIIPTIYPEENASQNINNVPEPFNGEMVNDDNINNIF